MEFKVNLKFPILEDLTHITFSDTGKEQLYAVQRDWEKFPVEAQEEFIKRLKYLNDYNSSDVTVEIGYDSSLYSFSLTWFMKGDYWFNGGLIWHGGPNDPFCVSITPQYWGIHT